MLTTFSPLIHLWSPLVFINSFSLLSFIPPPVFFHSKLTIIFHPALVLPKFGPSLTHSLYQLLVSKLKPSWSKLSAPHGQIPRSNLVWSWCWSKALSVSLEEYDFWVGTQSPCESLKSPDKPGWEKSGVYTCRRTGAKLRQTDTQPDGGPCLGQEALWTLWRVSQKGEAADLTRQWAENKRRNERGPSVSPVYGPSLCLRLLERELYGRRSFTSMMVLLIVLVNIESCFSAPWIEKLTDRWIERQIGH